MPRRIALPLSLALLLLAFCLWASGARNAPPAAARPDAPGSRAAEGDLAATLRAPEAGDPAQGGEEQEGSGGGRPGASWERSPAEVARVRTALLEYRGPRSLDMAAGLGAQKAWRDGLPEALRDEAVWLKSRAFLAEPADAAKGFALASPEDGFYLQFSSLPSAERIAAYRAGGLRLVRHLTGRTYFAVSTLADLNRFASDPLLQGAWEDDPADRLARSMASGEFAAEAAPGACRTSVLFEALDRAVGFAEAAAALAPYVQSLDSAEGDYADGLLQVTVPVQALLPMIRAVPELAFVDDSAFRSRKPCNRNAAALSRVDEVNAAGFTGSGEILAVVDEARVRASHQEMGGRVVIGDGATGLSSHATHVAGTMCALGVQAAAQGMSFGLASIRSYDWNGYNVDLADAGTSGAAAANNSWGFVTGWEWNGSAWQNAGGASRFGDYSAESRTVDNRANAAPGMKICWAAGNDRNDGASASQHDGTPVDLSPHWIGTGMPVNRYADLVGDPGCAKNLLTVGALTGSKAMTDFSSWGPADDGRVKPELCARGYNLYSPVSTGDAAYATYSGTSMATPVVTGALGCLTQAYRARFGASSAPADLMRAVLLQTAEDRYDVNGYRGPDLMTGFGLMDAKAALDLIQDPGVRTAAGAVSTGESADVAVVEVPPGDARLKVTMAWNDPTGDPSVLQALKNDLDLVLVSPEGEEAALSWFLDRLDPARPAQRGVNSVDNKEQAVWDAPAPGDYRVRVKGTSVPVSAPQAFAVATDRPAVSNALYLSRPLQVGRSSTFTILGPPGTPYRVYFHTSVRSAPFTFPGYQGDWWLAAGPTQLFTGTLDAAGRASRVLPIPNNPGYGGIRFYLQAVVGSGPVQHLTGRTDVVIRP